VRYDDLLVAQVQQSVACNALHAMEARLCRSLLQAHDCVDGDAIPLTQDFLGQILGVRRTTVTISARLLQTIGLIRYRRGLIQILDRRALEEMSCECYAAVRQNVNKLFPAPPNRVSAVHSVCPRRTCGSADVKENRRRERRAGDINVGPLPCTSQTRRRV
jgi:hypothetical protein